MMKTSPTTTVSSAGAVGQRRLAGPSPGRPNLTGTFHITPHRSRARLHRKTYHSAPPVSTKAEPGWVLLSDALTSIPEFMTKSSPSIYAYEALISTAAAVALITWEGRPLGCSCSLVEVQDSGVHGKGVFATENIPSGTSLGVYPGLARSPAEMVAKVRRAPAAKDYCLVSEAGMPIDPTNARGELSQRPEGCLWPFPDDITLARVNEPPLGMSVNAEMQTTDGERRVAFFAIRDIQAGEEIFIDYGPIFDRSSYSSPAP